MLFRWSWNSIFLQPSLHIPKCVISVQSQDFIHLYVWLTILIILGFREILLIASIIQMAKFISNVAIIHLFCGISFNFFPFFATRGNNKLIHFTASSAYTISKRFREVCPWDIILLSFVCLFVEGLENCVAFFNLLSISKGIIFISKYVRWSVTCDQFSTKFNTLVLAKSMVLHRG